MRIASLIVLLCVSSSCAAAADELADGIKSYGEFDYGTAVRLLSAATKGKYAKNATAHYYLANAYLHMKNSSAALAEYRESLKLAPQAESAIHCKNAILHLTASATAPVQVAETDDKVAVAHPKIAVVEASPIRLTGLPSIPNFPKDDGPKLADVMTWSQAQQSNYFQIAYDRKNEALLRLEKTQDALKRAQSLASSAVPSARQFGETDAMLKARVESGRAQMASILKPFEDAVEIRQKEAEQCNSIYETCVSAGRRLSGY